MNNNVVLPHKSDMYITAFFLGVPIVAVIGLLSSIIPTPYWAKMSFFISLLLVIFTAYKGKKTMDLKRELSTIKKYFAISGIFMIMMPFTYIALAAGLPSFINPLIVHQFERKVTINKLSFGGGKTCFGGFNIWFKEDSHWLGASTCLSKTAANKLRKGDKLLAKGKQSWLGYSYDEEYLYSNE